jgi:hypothetical protein
VSEGDKERKRWGLYERIGRSSSRVSGSGEINFAPEGNMYTRCFTSKDFLTLLFTLKVFGSAVTRSYLNYYVQIVKSPLNIFGSGMLIFFASWL